MLLDSNGITLNLMKSLFFKDNIQWVFFLRKVFNQIDQIKRKLKKHMHQKNAKKIRIFFGFPNYVKQFMPNFSAIK